MQDDEMINQPEIIMPSAEDQKAALEDAIAERDRRQRMAALLTGFKQLARAGAQVGGKDIGIDTTTEQMLADSGQQLVKDQREKQAIDRQAMLDRQREILRQAQEKRAQAQEERAQEGFELNKEQAKQSFETAKIKAERMGLKLQNEQQLNNMLDKSEGPIVNSVRKDLQIKLNQRAEQQGYEPEILPQDLTLRQLNHLDDFVSQGQGGLSEYQRQMVEIQKERLKQADRRLELGTKKEGRLTQGQEFKQEEKQEISDKQTSELEAFDTGQNLINRIKELYPSAKENLGFYASNIEEGKKFVPFLEKDNDFVAMQALVGTQLADYVKQISGAAVSEEEAQRLARNIPSMTDKPNEFQRKMDEFEKILQENRQIKIEAFEKQGKDPSGFKNKESKEDMVKMMTPKGPKMIPKDMVEQAKAAGATEM